MTTRVTVVLDEALVRQVDRLVQDAHYPSRSHAIEVAVAEHLGRLRRRRLADACTQLDAEEAALAEATCGADAASWPPY